MYECPCCLNTIAKNFSTSSFAEKSSMSYPIKFEKLKIITCHKCRFSFTNEPIDEKILRDYYKNHYTGKSIKSNSWKKSYVRSKHQYSDRSIAQMTLINQFFAWEGKKILEIGSANGQLLTDIKNRGNNINGYVIEPQIINLDYFLDNNITPVDIDIIEKEQEFDSIEVKYDLVIMSHSLEHFNSCNINTIFKNVYNLLNYGGLFFIEVPNANLIEYSTDLEKMAPHLSFFSQESLILFAKKHLFKIEYSGLFGNSQKQNEKNAALSEKNNIEDNYSLDEKEQIKINNKTLSKNIILAKKNKFKDIFTVILTTIGLKNLLIALKFAKVAISPSFFNFNRRDFLSNNVDGEFIRIIAKKVR